MVKKFDRNKLRQKKHRSIRKKIVGTACCVQKFTKYLRSSN